jgi:hypothetical protein
VVGPRPNTQLETWRLAGERVMTIGLEQPNGAVSEVDSWAREIASFEAAQPPLILVSASANADACGKLVSLLTRAGFVQVMQRAL